MPSSTSTHPSHRRAEVNAHIDSIQRQLDIGSTRETSIHRDPSEFEVILQGRSRSRDKAKVDPVNLIVRPAELQPVNNQLII
jgi:hypothetical protein